MILTCLMLPESSYKLERLKYIWDWHQNLITLQYHFDYYNNNKWKFWWNLSDSIFSRFFWLKVSWTHCWIQWWDSLFISITAVIDDVTDWCYIRCFESADIFFQCSRATDRNKWTKTDYFKSSAVSEYSWTCYFTTATEI